MNQFKWIGIGVLTVFLAACGGGSAGGEESPVPSGLEQLQRAVVAPEQVPSQALLGPFRVQPMSVAAPAITPDQFFDWAERTYPGFYPGHQADQSMQPFVLRYYPATANFIAISGDLVYALGPVTGNQVIVLGKLADFACRVQPLTCPPPVVDTIPPLLAIASPSSSGSYSSTSASLIVSGTASDNVGVTQVSWSNDRGGNGTATLGGSASVATWSTASITMQPGSNTLTINARDAAGNTAALTLVVSYNTSGTPNPHSFVELFKWQGNHASTINRTNSSGTIDHVGSTVWWNEDAWDIVGDSGYLSIAYSDFGPVIGKETGFHVDVHKAASADPTNSAEDNTVLIVGGNGSAGEAAMRLDEQGVLGARLRNPMLISGTRAGVVEFYAPRFVTTGHWWEVAITPANQITGGTSTSVPAQIGRRPFEDGLNVVVIGHDDVPCLVGWHVRYDVSKTVNGVETLLEEQHSTVEQFTGTDPSEKDDLYHWRIEFRPTGVDLYADFQKTGAMQLQRHVDVSIPWPEVHVHLLGVAYQADHHPQNPACYQGKVRELNWRNVSVSPVKYARTSTAPRNGVTTNVQRSTGWMGYDLRDIQRFGAAVNGAPQANLAAYDSYGAMAFGSVDLRWAGAPAPVTKKDLSVDLSAEQAGAALTNLVYDIKGRGSVQLTVNGTAVGATPDMNSVRFYAAQVRAGDNNLGEYTHRGVTIPVGLLKAGVNLIHFDLKGEVVLDRLHLEFGHLQ